MPNKYIFYKKSPIYTFHSCVGGGCLNLCQVARKIFSACCNYSAAKLQHLWQRWLEQKLHQLTAMLRYINFSLSFLEIYSAFLWPAPVYRRKGNIFVPPSLKQYKWTAIPLQSWAPGCLKIYRTVGDSLHLTWIHLSCFFQYRASTSVGTLRCELGYFPGATIPYQHIETNRNDTFCLSKTQKGCIVLRKIFCTCQNSNLA